MTPNLVSAGSIPTVETKKIYNWAAPLLYVLFLQINADHAKELADLNNEHEEHLR